MLSAGAAGAAGDALERPHDIRWSCLQCGRSCEDWSEVWIDAPTAFRIARLPLFNPRLDPLEGGRLPYRVSAHDPAERVLATRDDGDGGTACVLLDRDRLCAIHAAHGEPAKPASCRAFPLVRIESPGGTRLAVSFACTAVLHDHGAPLAESGRERDESGDPGNHHERRGVGARLAPGEPLPWREYQVLEVELLDVLAAAPDVESGLFEQGRRLRALAHLAPADPRPSAPLRGFTLAWLLDRVGPPPRFRDPVAGLVPPDPERLLRRWVAHRIWRRDLLRGGEVLFAHGLLLAEVALARCWARVSRGGMAEAVAQVERGLVLHSDLIARIERDQALLRTASRLFGAPRYAASLSAGVPA